MRRIVSNRGFGQLETFNQFTLSQSIHCVKAHMHAEINMTVKQIPFCKNLFSLKYNIEWSCNWSSVCSKVNYNVMKRQLKKNKDSFDVNSPYKIVNSSLTY